MDTKLHPAPAPEIIIGLVAPVGVDLELVCDALTDALSEMSYATHVVPLTKFMREIKFDLPLDSEFYIQSIRERIAYANAVRAKFDDDALAKIAVSVIRRFRNEEWERNQTEDGQRKLQPGGDGAIERDAERATRKTRAEETPLPSQAYVVRQLKRPEEVSLLRSIYGKQFVLVSAYASEDVRRRRIEREERKSRGGVITPVNAHNAAYDLVAQDSKEDTDSHGQNVRDAFPLGDVFIDTSTKAVCESAVRRFVRLFFGNNEITPTRDEYGMYMAKSAALRSSDLSRQVGAAICRHSGGVISLGCNEVPKAGGGAYWCGDSGDGRDFVRGYDTNDRYKLEVLGDLLSRLKDGRHLAQDLQELETPEAITQQLMGDKPERGVAGSRLMDIIEFGRMIHAEMSAITDAARYGRSINGATLYCTTFPCHVCAKHIVASGISRLVFIEPYAKSYASDLHDDSISVNGPAPSKVSFETFMGVAPNRFRDLFEKKKRKASGKAQEWNMGECRPMIEVYFPSYFQAETYIVDAFHQAVKQFEREGQNLVSGTGAVSVADSEVPVSVPTEPKIETVSERH